MDSGVSCIIPVYNAEKYLRSFIDCLRKQDYQDVEYIFVNDCSTDSSLQILEDEKQDNFVIINNSYNVGAGEARNIGIESAEKKYIICLDCDDIILPTLIGDVYYACEKSGADVGVFYSGVLGDGPKKNYIPDRKGKNLVNLSSYPVAYPKEQDYRWFFLITNSPFDKMVRRELLISNNIRFQNIPKAEDMSYSFWCMMQAVKICYVDKVLHFWRPGEGIHTRNYPQGIVEAIGYIYSKNRQFADQHGFWNFAVERFYLSAAEMPDVDREKVRLLFMKLINECHVDINGLNGLASICFAYIMRNDFSRTYYDIHYEYTKNTLKTEQGNKKIIQKVLFDCMITCLYSRNIYCNYIVSSEILSLGQMYCILKNYLTNKIKTLLVR